MRYVARRPDLPDPSPVTLAIDAEIRLVWRDASMGRIDVGEANRRCLELTAIRDARADLAVQEEEATPCPRP